jgi:hypothetical protein
MPRGAKVSDADLAQVQKLRGEGMTVKDIAKRLKLNYWQTYSRLRKMGGTKRRAKGGARGRRAQRQAVRSMPAMRNGRRSSGSDLSRWAQALVNAGVDPMALAVELLRIGR